MTHGPSLFRAALLVAVPLGLLLTSSTAATVAVPPPHPRPAHPASGFVQRGFALPAYSRDAYRSSRVPESLRELVAVGATWVQLNPTWYQGNPLATSIAPTARSPSDASVEYAIQAAHRVGLKVLLKPLVDLAPDGTGYRGTIRPPDLAAWFASYTRFISHFAALAERQTVEEFGLGTELAGVSSQRASWLAVVQAVRARYHGPVLYAANFDEYRNVTFWDALDLIGIDAYWPVSSHPTADVEALRRAWIPIVRELATFAAGAGKPILFTEAGYPSQRGSTTAPWSWTTSRTPDQDEQASAYQALLASLTGRPWWAGVFWWAWDVPSAPSGHDPLNYSPHAKAAEAVVRRWWN